MLWASRITDKLENIRQTVDEKLQSTLNERLGASFQVVSDWLEKVHLSIGEMQNLANGVGDLKRLLTNVRARGAWGRSPWAACLRRSWLPISSAERWRSCRGAISGSSTQSGCRATATNRSGCRSTRNSRPKTERLEHARQYGNVEAVDSAGKAIETAVRFAAKGISSKYVHSPHSTEFAVLFRPTEGLFAEVIRRPGLVDALQRDYRIMVAGPTTLVSLLVALRMGFRSLAIQQRSGEVWRVLSAVKTEFAKFGGILDKVSKKLREAQAVVDDEAGVRRRAMDRKLRNLEVLPEIEAARVLELDRIEEVDADPVDRNDGRVRTGYFASAAAADVT